MRSDKTTPTGAACRRARAGLAACLAAAVAGCAAPRVSEPLTRSLSGNGPHDRGEFWYQFARRPLASNDEAFHALLLYRDGTDPASTYAGRVKAMVADHMLPADFNGAADEAIDRGTLAVAIDQLVGVEGGVTMRLFGPSPRYALRAAVDAGLFPRSSPNQTLSGGEFVAIMQKAEEYQRGSPADGPASLLPDQIHPVAPAPVASAPQPSANVALPPGTATVPVVYLDDVINQMTPPAATQAAATTAPAGPVHLKARVIDVQGDLVQLRSGPSAEWKAAEVGMTLREGTEIRTGPRSAIKFLVPRDESFCLDSQGLVTFREAVLNGRAARTRVDLSHGRLREDLSHEMQVQQAGLDHDTVIQSPNSALTIRGTKVSLFEQPSFEPVAISLTGRALFTNTAGMRVAFGAADHRHVVIVGGQTSAAEQAQAREASLAESGNTAEQAFETREQAIVSERGGFRRGDVIVGDLTLADFGTKSGGAPNLPGALDFVLQWSGTQAHTLNDLNLAVFSPLHAAGSPDFVANPPFTVSLTPNSPTSIATRLGQYPRTSRSGGQISDNSVGPDGLELAFWPKNYPTGTYRVRVYDLADAVPPPTATVNPVTYTLQVYRGGDLLGSYTGSVGQLQTSPTIAVQVPAVVATAAKAAASRWMPAGLVRTSSAGSTAWGRRRAKS